MRAKRPSNCEEPGWSASNDAAPVEPEWLSETIGTIYDCVLEPAGWADVIEGIATRYGFSDAVLGVLRTNPGAHQLVVHYGYDADWLAVADLYTEDYVSLWGGAARLQNYPLDEPILLSEVRPPDASARLAYVRDILAPRGFIEAVGIALAREPHTTGYLAMSRHRSAEELRPGQLRELRLVTPHLRRAVTISNLFDLRAVESATFHAVLEGMRHAAILVDESTNVIHINRAADALLAESAEIEVRRGQLTLKNQLAQRALVSALRLAGEREALLAQRGIGIPVTSDSASPLVLHVMPLQKTEIRRSLSQRAVAAIFIVPAAQTANPPLAAISLLYDLTPAETQVFAAIAGGKTLAETAYALGVGRGTAKTHLLRVFQKTGTKRQADLVMMANNLSLPI